MIRQRCKIPSLGRGAAVCVMAGRGHLNAKHFHLSGGLSDRTLPTGQVCNFTLIDQAQNAGSSPRDPAGT